MNAVNATPHAELIAELMNCNVPKNEREHAAAREIERLQEALAQTDAFEQGRQEGMKQERALWELSKFGQEIEAQPKQEPVEYQMRMRPTWEATSWSDWKKCSRDAAGDYTKTPKLHDWEYETRKLYAQPITQASPQIPQKDASNEKRNNFLNGYCVGQTDLLAEQANQEPAAWMIYTQDGQSVYVTDNPTDIQECQRALPLYITSPQRPWVGLTGQEKALIASVSLDVHAAVHRTAAKLKAVNGFLKEKNT